MKTRTALARLVLRAGIALIAGLVLHPSPALAHTSVDDWGTDGAVDALTVSGHVLYFGGSFLAVGRTVGSFAAIDRGSGMVERGRLPRVAGPVNCLIPDGSGGWYLGGAFVGVGGESRAGLAHVKANGQVARWNPPGPDAEIQSLALWNGVLFVGGSFEHIGGVERHHVAAFDVSSGQVTSWRPDTDAAVRCLLVQDSTIVVGGDFTEAGGERRMGVAELSLRTGHATAWDPDVETSGYPGSVRCLCRVGKTIYLGGAFWYLRGQRHRNLAAVDAESGLATAWSPDVMTCNCNSYDLPASVEQILFGQDGMLYVCGHFDRVNDLDRGGLAAIDPTTGSPTPWDAHLGPRFQNEAPTVRCMAFGDGTLYIGSLTSLVGSEARPGAAEVSLRDGTPTAWNPKLDDSPRALVVQGGTIFAAGYFQMIGYQPRRGLAAIDLQSGELTDWNPSPDGFGILCLASTPDRVYAGGYFNQIGGGMRAHLAALDPVTGSALPWLGNADAPVQALQVANGRLYAGGGFRTINGASRPYAAAFDLATGFLTAWMPTPNRDVYAIHASEGRVYLGGLFWSVGGVERSYFAAVSATTGGVLDVHPSLDGQVFAIAQAPGKVFLGGMFTAVDGASRPGLAAVRDSDGALLPWGGDLIDDRPLIHVYGLGVAGDDLYACGHMSSLSGHPRNGVVALDLESGEVEEWDAELGGGINHPGVIGATVYGLTTQGHKLYLGGEFSWSGTTPLNTLAEFRIGNSSHAPLARSGRDEPRNLALSPNPASGNTKARFHLDAAAVVRLRLFDIRGRQIASLVDRELQPAGDNELTFPLAGLRPGVYFCRLDSPQGTETQKLVVLGGSEWH